MADFRKKSQFVGGREGTLEWKQQQTRPERSHPSSSGGGPARGRGRGRGHGGVRTTGASRTGGKVHEQINRGEPVRLTNGCSH